MCSQQERNQVVSWQLYSYPRKASGIKYGGRHGPFGYPCLGFPSSLVSALPASPLLPAISSTSPKSQALPPQESQLRLWPSAHPGASKESWPRGTLHKLLLQECWEGFLCQVEVPVGEPQETVINGLPAWGLPTQPGLPLC